MSVIIILVLFALMWVALIVPRQREVKRHRALVAGLEVGDEVMSTSGIYGTIRAVEADHVDLEVAPGLTLRMAKRAVAAKVPPPGGSESLRAAFGGAAGEDELPAVGDGGVVEAGGAHDDAGGAADGPRPDRPADGGPT
jgi:preprotein translocase subunit YajC